MPRPLSYQLKLSLFLSLKDSVNSRWLLPINPVSPSQGRARSFLTHPYLRSSVPPPLLVWVSFFSLSSQPVRSVAPPPPSSRWECFGDLSRGGNLISISCAQGLFLSFPLFSLDIAGILLFPDSFYPPRRSEQAEAALPVLSRLTSPPPPAL